MPKENQGWVKIHRRMMDMDGYFSEAFCRNMAWVDLILLANHDDNFFRVRNIRVDVRRGQVGYGVEQLGERWKWSRGKVERFLKELETDKRVIRQKNNVTTLISLVNYKDYQEGDTANSKASDKADGHQTVKQTDINKNEKNEKNEKKINKPVKKRLPKILFRESEIFEKVRFAAALFGTAYQDADIEHYHRAALRWSDSDGNRKVDWTATLMNWMDRDRSEGKFKTKNSFLNGTSEQSKSRSGGFSKTAGIELAIDKALQEPDVSGD
jgi:hypothetical protein